MELVMRDLRAAYVYLVDYVRDKGRLVQCRGYGTHELTGVTLQFHDTYKPLLPIGVNRGVNTSLAAVEALQLIAGESHPTLVTTAAKSFTDVLVDDQDLDYGAYGLRTREQLKDVMRLLRDDPTTRQAVVKIWDENDLTHQGDRPCTIFMQFLIRDGALHLHTHMRSNDVWLGTPYDVFSFTQLQHTMALALDVESGEYHHHVTSLHLYRRDFEKASQLALPDESDEENDSRVYSLPCGVDEGIIKKPWPWYASTASDLLAGSTYRDDENPWYTNKLERLFTREA